jgi:hypothetical protein
MNLADLTGTVGVTLILLAYTLNLFSVIPKNGRLFLLLNLLGAALACYASVLISYTPFIILEGAWAFISAIALIRHLQCENKNNAT